MTCTSASVIAEGSSVEIDPTDLRDSTVEQSLMSSLLRSLMVDSA